MFYTKVGKDFEVKLPVIIDILTKNNVNIGGFELNITYHDENIKIEFLKMNWVYIHMLGYDCHSIVAESDYISIETELFYLMG